MMTFLLFLLLFSPQQQIEPQIFGCVVVKTGKTVKIECPPLPGTAQNHIQEISKEAWLSGSYLDWRLDVVRYPRQRIEESKSLPRIGTILRAKLQDGSLVPVASCEVRMKQRADAPDCAGGK